LVYRGLALFQLDRKEEAEKVRVLLLLSANAYPDQSQSYLHAYRIQPSNPLASLGVRKLYEKISAWEKLGRFLETLVQEAYDQ
jgi:superkiller protein 3